MTNAERDEMLIRMHENLKEIRSALERDYKHIHGNGQPGLLARVQALEDFHANENRWAKKLGTVAAWIVTTIVSVIALAKHDT